MDREILHFWYSQTLNKSNKNLQIPRANLKLIPKVVCSVTLDYVSNSSTAISFMNLNTFLISFVFGHKTHQRTLKYI